MKRRLFANSPIRIFLLAVACLSAIESKSDELTKAENPATDPMLGKEAGDARDDNGLKMKFVWCPPGSVTMEYAKGGYNAVKLQTTPVQAFLGHGYWLGKYEVTQAEWKQAMSTEPWKGKRGAAEGDDFPVVCVNPDDAMEFCRKLTELERTAGRLSDGWEYTLPTEAQWERACRARTESTFSFGDDKSKLGEYAWFAENSIDLGARHAQRVGQKKPNPWGLHDVHGNVWEWCRDYYAEILPGGRDPEVVKKGDERVMRGGCWLSPAQHCWSAVRFGGGGRDAGGVGFRVALTPVRPVK